MEVLYYAALVVLSYLIGAIPFGLVVGKFSRNIDLRDFGSGNIGAANALRTLGWKASALVFVLDIAKAVVAVLLARVFTGLPVVEALCGFAAIVGHNWPVYIGFRGGRGVSSSLGVMLVFSPLIAVAGLALGLLLMASFRYVSLGSVVGALSVPVLLLVFAASMSVPVPYLWFAWVVGLLVVFQHRSNIRRIITGTEHKIGQRAERRT